MDYQIPWVAMAVIVSMCVSGHGQSSTPSLEPSSSSSESSPLGGYNNTLGLMSPSVSQVLPNSASSVTPSADAPSLATLQPFSSPTSTALYSASAVGASPMTNVSPSVAESSSEATSPFSRALMPSSSLVDSQSASMSSSVAASQVPTASPSAPSTTTLSATSSSEMTTSPLSSVSPAPRSSPSLEASQMSSSTPSTILSSQSTSSPMSHGATTSPSVAVSPKVSTSPVGGPSMSSVALASSSSARSPPSSHSPTPAESVSPSIGVSSVSATTSLIGVSPDMSPSPGSSPIATSAPFATSSSEASTSLSLGGSPSASVNPTVASSSSSTLSATSVSVSPSPTPNPGPDKVFYASFKVVANCVGGIKENNPQDQAYKDLKDKVIKACQDAFKNDTKFKKVELERFDCGSVIPQLKLTLSGDAPADGNTALQPLSDAVLANRLTNLNVESGSFKSARSLPLTVEPNLYVILELSLSNDQFCSDITTFKENLAKRIFKDDGQTPVSPSDVVVYENECRNLANTGTQKAAPRFYVATDGNINTPDTTLTKRAHDLIKQYIKDGTTSRLGAAFDGKVIKVSYGGKDAPADDKLSDLAIVFIAIGATIGFLLFVILIVLICRGACKPESKREVKMNNPIYIEDGVGGRDNPALVVDEDEKPKSGKIKVDDNEYEYPVGPANGSATRNGVTHAEVRGNNNNGYVDMEPAEYQSLKQSPAATAAEESKAETPPPDYQALAAVDTEKKDEDAIPTEYIELSDRPSAEVEVSFNSDTLPPEPAATVAPEVTPEVTPEVAPLIADAPPILQAEVPPKVEVEPEADIKVAEPSTASVGEVVVEAIATSEGGLAEESAVDAPDDIIALAGSPLGPDEVATRKDDLDQLRNEFESIEYSLPDTSIYPPSLIQKNRFPSIVPRPETRVVLPAIEMTINSDYINANFVRDRDGNKSYIATQGPLQSTANDFWRMIWDQKARVVVMVTPLIHMGMEKCFQYWPPDSITRKYGEIEVQLKKKELRPDFTVTTMAVKHGSDIRELVLYRYMTWPEDAIPESPKSTVTFLLEVRKLFECSSANPLVVHCSDGVGVTGVFIAIDQGMRSLDESKTVDVVSLVRSIREDRAGAVQTCEQYQFIYKALYEYAQMTESNKPADALQNAKSNVNDASSKM